MSLKEKAEQLKNETYALYLASKDKRVPWYAKGFVIVIVAYALSPIDFIPDFIPVLGYVDDLIILPALVALTVKLIPQDIFLQCQNEAQGLCENDKPKKWYYAIPVILLWLILILLIVKVFINKH